MPPDPGNRSLLFAFAQERVQYYIYSKTDLGGGAVILRKRVLCSGVVGFFAEAWVYQAVVETRGSTGVIRPLACGRYPWRVGEERHPLDSSFAREYTGLAGSPLPT